MYTWRISKPNGEGKVHVIGVDLGATPELWQPDISTALHHDLTGKLIVLKIPGSSYQNRGYITYSGTYFQVLRVERLDNDGNLICEPVIDIPIRKGK